MDLTDHPRTAMEPSQNSNTLHHGQEEWNRRLSARQQKQQLFQSPHSLRYFAQHLRHLRRRPLVVDFLFFTSESYRSSVITPPSLQSKLPSFIIIIIIIIIIISPLPCPVCLPCLSVCLSSMRVPCAAQSPVCLCLQSHTTHTHTHTAVQHSHRQARHPCQPRHTHIQTRTEQTLKTIHSARCPPQRPRLAGSRAAFA
ncbi:hypothetical protein IWX49DRAFT_329637 [Phyllosticta citricarpa]|uniref:Uncharacterized protein n=1 Tax=Phyllosticta citricarpa TaxID=55181 RepID=A0ABR1M761_9PEZI